MEEDYTVEVNAYLIMDRPCEMAYKYIQVSWPVVSSPSECAMNEFSIRRVNPAHRQAHEVLGSKPKYWFRDGDRHLLFKQEARGTGEDWAEVVACHLCQLLGLPHVDYELADEDDDDGTKAMQRGVVCENMVSERAALILGNELLLDTDPQYPKSQRFKVRQYTVPAVKEIVEQLALPPNPWLTGCPAGMEPWRLLQPEERRRSMLRRPILSH
jgi:hypothetical protein